ncbi:Sec23/Sec24 trunk domain-containing protein [Chlamydoabsidia padenii]|nr:Sec23/Sec24 trunk domain-containing protein [Chlamydoabsidia padenii]
MASSTVSDHHKRKRMYPKAYVDESSSPAGYAAPGVPTPGINQLGAPTDGYQQPQAPMLQQQLQQQQQQQQQPQFTSPMAPQVPAYNQQPQGQPPMQPHQQYGQKGMDDMVNQFGNMNMNQTMPAVPLLGAPPPIGELVIEPKIHLPPNVSITNSPYANCDSSYKCCTVNAVPATESLLKKSRLPFALVLAPYRSLKEGDEPVPVVSDSVIARCRRCRTYINPFVTFVEGGQRWKCNMCFLLNDVPAAFDYDAHTQQQADRWKRPELNYGCVEFVAPTEYMVRPPQAPAFVFVLDVSYSAVQSGMLATATRTLLDTLERLPNEDNRTNIAIITVDSALHFYNFTNTVDEPQMLVVADLEDVFLPQPEGLFANLTRSMEGIKTLLEKLPDMFKDTVNVNNALGPALQAAFKMLAANGGKIICLQSTLPNTGTGALKSREDVKLLGTAKETALLNPASPFYKTFAVDCSRSQVACDMLIFGGQYADVATLSCLPHYTGGQTYYYPGFNASRSEDALKFAHEFSELLAEQIGLEAVIRIRASRGLRMNAFHGNFFIRSTDLLALPNVPRDQNYCVEVVIEDDLKTPTVCFQTALLHTSCTGERRIRVVTLCLPVSNSMSELYASVNQKAVADYLGTKAVERALTSKLDDARDAVVNKLVDMFGVYKTHVLGSAQGSTPQLTVPDNMKLLAVLALGLIKHDGLRQSSQIPTDMRANAMNLLRTMPLQLLIPYIHPNFYSLHNMPPEAGEVTEKGVTFPPTLNLTAERIEAHGCYLLENGQNIYLWVGRGVVPQLCMDLFDVNSYEALRGGKYTLPMLETPLNKKVNLLIGKIREMRRGNYYPTLYLVKEDGDPYLKIWFMSHLIEDRTENVMSYQQFLQFIKDRVGSSSF